MMRLYNSLGAMLDQEMPATSDGDHYVTLVAKQTLSYNKDNGQPLMRGLHDCQ